MASSGAWKRIWNWSNFLIARRGGVWWGWTACVGDNGEDWRGEMAVEEQGMCVKWPIQSVMQLGARLPLRVVVSERLSSWTTCSLPAPHGDTTTSALLYLIGRGQPRDLKRSPRSLSPHSLTPQCTKGHNIATVQYTGDQYNWIIDSSARCWDI